MAGAVEWGMSDAFHYPPDLMALLVNTVSVLCRGKKDVILFFRGAGAGEEDMAPDRKSVV